MAKKKPGESNSVESNGSQPTFEESVARLEEIVEQLEDGQLTLGESLSAYEEGVKHLKTCYEALTDAERKIEVLAGFDASGNPVMQPFDDAATAGEASVGRRSRSAKAPASESPSRGEVDDRRELF
jgi:exodeoxyribonuclease VII small subunit